MKNKKNVSYEEAYTELQEILNHIQNEETGVDELSEKIKRAVFLINVCKVKLRSTEKEIAALFGEE